MRTFVFLDTNIFLHFPQIEDIPWKALIRRDDITLDVTLVVTSVVIRELNRHKDSPDSPKLRDRAAAALKKLHDYSEKTDPITVRDSITLVFHTQEPLLNFASAGLVRELSDDYLVATMLEFKRNPTQRDAILITDDLGLKLKARAYEITTLRPPQDLRLPEELDPHQKRIRELEERVRQLQFSVPDLKLVFRSWEDRLQFVLKPEIPLSPTVLSRRLKRVQGKFPKMQKPTAFSGADLRAGTILAPAAYDDYNARLDTFYSDYGNYLHRLQDYLNQRRRTLELDIWATNTGTCPARDADIFMRFPDNPVVALKSQIPNRPSPPEAPDRPRPPATSSPGRPSSDATMAGLNTGLTALSYGPQFVGNYEAVSTARTTITREPESGQQARMTVAEAKHNLMTSVDTLYAVFKSHAQVRSFTIRYDIFCANIPEKQSGQLHVIVGSLGGMPSSRRGRQVGPVGEQGKELEPSDLEELPSGEPVAPTPEGEK